MRKTLIGLLALALIAPALASAHTLKTSGDVGVLLHIDPDDDPVAGQPAALYVSVTDKASGAACGCALAVLDGSSTVYAAPLAGQGASVPLTFPHAGIYQIVVTGAGAPMPAFSVTFDQRVEAAAESSGPPLPLYAAAGALILLILVVGMGFFISRTKRI